VNSRKRKVVSRGRGRKEEEERKKKATWWREVNSRNVK